MCGAAEVMGREERDVLVGTRVIPPTEPDGNRARVCVCVRGFISFDDEHKL